MKTQNNLSKLRKAIISEIPEIVELKMGCKIKSKADNIGRYIVKERREYRGGITYIYYDIVNSLMRELPFVIGCNDLEDNYEIIGRKITLADVLRVLEKQENEIAINSNGIFIIFDNLGFEFSKAWDKEGKLKWDLSKDLSLQSEEIINFLSKIILKGDD